MRRLDIEFVGRRRPPMRGWLLLYLGIAAVTIAAFQGSRHYRQHEAAVHALRKAQRQQQALQAAAPKSTPPYTADPQWQHAATELERPWLATLQALESQTLAPVYLLEMTTDAVTGDIRLVADVPTFDDGLDYLGALSQSAALTNTSMSSHETVQDAGGRSFLRVKLSTHWVMP